MGFLFPKSPSAPPPPPPPPMIDDAAARMNETDRASKRGRRTTLLTGDTGLPDLGSTTTVQR